jgi:hypothetical protein
MGAESHEASAPAEAGSNRAADDGGDPDGHSPALDSLSIRRMFELIERAEHRPSALQDTEIRDGEDEAAEPKLLVPIERTPLPEVDRAMPVLSLFPAVIGRRRGRYKVALLKTLQDVGAGRWKIRQIQESVFWLEPSAVAELVRELRDADVLSYDPIRMTYRMSPTGRVIGALLSALRCRRSSRGG